MSSNKVVDHALNFRARLEGNGKNEDELRADRARTKVGEIEIIRARLAASADGHLSRAADKVLAAGIDRRMSDDGYKEFVSSVHRAADLAKLDGALGDLQTAYQERERDLRVVREPTVYGGESPHSFFRDVAATADQDNPVAQRTAWDRLHQHGREVEAEIRDRSVYGKHAEQVLRDQVRRADIDEHRRRFEELRAITTGGGMTASASGGGGAALVTPSFLMSHWAPYMARSPFANAANTETIPAFGMETYVPALQTDGAMAQQTEGSALAESDPAGGLLSAQVVPISGKVTISQQLQDRSGGPSGPAYDRVIGKQLGIDYSRALDSYALTTALATAGQVAYTNASFVLAGTSGTGQFIDKLSAAKNAVRGTAGSQFEPSAAFFVPARWELIAGWADAQGHPILPPHLDQGDGRPYGDTGLNWGGLHVWTDPNIPAPASGADQVVVVDPEEVFLWRSPQPIISAYAETSGAALQIVITARAYAACIVRYPSVVQAISGSGMAAVSL